MAWNNKLKSWIPPHFKTREYEPLINSLATLFEAFEVDLNDFIAETLISQASSDFLPLHGQERGIPPLNLGGNFVEDDDAYQDRIRRIKYNRTKENIRRNILSLSGVRRAEIVDDFPNGVFSGDKNKLSESLATEYPPADWGNYGPLGLEKRMGCFSVVLEVPERDPLGFFDDGKFYNKDLYWDTRSRTFNETIVRVLKELIKVKSPAGSSFRLLVKGYSGISIGDEASQQDDANS